MLKKSLFKINLTNRGFYTLIVLGILTLVGMGVLALTPGTAPNPGHLLSEISPPSPCVSGDVIGWDGTNLICTTSSGGNLWTQSGSSIYYNNGNVGIGTTTPRVKLEVQGNILASNAIGIGTPTPAATLDVRGDIYFLTGRNNLYDTTNGLTGCSQNNPPIQLSNPACTCLTGLQSNTPTCTYNSFMTINGNNFYDCRYSCKTKKMGIERYSVKDLWVKLGSPVGSFI